MANTDDPNLTPDPIRTHDRNKNSHGPQYLANGRRYVQSYY